MPLKSCAAPPSLGLGDRIHHTRRIFSAPLPLRYPIIHPTPTGHHDVVRELPDRKVTPNHVNSYGTGVAPCAPRSGATATSRGCCSSAVQMPTRVHQHGTTALIRACTPGQADAVRALVHHGADAEAPDQDGCKAMLCGSSGFGPIFPTGIHF